MKIGLFFGSFNPIHTGHLILAHTVMEESGLDKIWFVVSPQNPFKEKSTLLHEFDRFDMVSAAVKDDERFEASDVEFRLPKPSYTIDTVVNLQEKYPHYSFALIMGEDNLSSFHKWKNYQSLLKYCEVFYYPRSSAKEVKGDVFTSGKLHKIDAAVLEISSTYIRSKIRVGKSIRYLVPKLVRKLIEEKGFYL